MSSKNSVNKIFQRLASNNAKPTTELNFTSNFELLIAVVLSAQATDVSVNLATAKLFKVANTPEQIIALGEVKLATYIKTIGLFNSKARNIIKLCEQLVVQHASFVPDDRVSLENLPGVGRKTANVVLNTAFKHAVIAVDTHIFRVATRLGLSKAKTPLGVEQDLMQAVPAKYLLDAHHWLILHGRYVCKARNPNCSACILNDLCPHAKNNIL